MDNTLSVFFVFLQLKAQFDCENMEVYYVDSEGDYVSLIVMV